MVRYGSLFSQVLSLVDRVDLYNLVFKHDAERRVEGYSSEGNSKDRLLKLSGAYAITCNAGYPR